ncbi:VWA domain-containing protein [Blastopirellula marina]|uniref:BatB n=1 Tax=Blastopirellula marina DSM 3645 TaxID=314230 RepID=A3ZYA6_9BACT|nr:VWA domain-containing protein [Blastopirellula marina]EAQ78582.1 BatB [Blastopirellula marina DSM 3645]
MHIQLGNPDSIALIALVAIGMAVTAWAIAASRRAAGRFAMDPLRRRLMPSGTAMRRWGSAILVSISLTMIAIALLDVRWGKAWSETPQKGIEVMFVLDVSRSMLAEDVTPNRLQRAKQQIKDMLKVMAGDRVGLIAFAGETRQSVPLTSHYEDFKQTLDSVGPHTVRSGGSRLGDAIAAASKGFIDKTYDHKAIVVFTDGEDQESKPVEVAKSLYAERGIRVFTVGLGDMDQGSRIPESEAGHNDYVQYQGQQVWSKLNGQVLEQIATETNGAYIPAGTRHVNMADVYRNYLVNVEQTEFETAKINAYIVRFQWFAAPALALLLLEVFVSSRNSKLPPSAASRVTIRSSQKAAASNARSTSPAA